VNATCGAVLKSDVGSDYTCTEPKGHTDDHCDSRHPFSWRQDASHMTQGRVILKSASNG
jgi:hypothetical protein